MGTLAAWIRLPSAVELRRGRFMKRRSGLLIAGLTIAGTVLASTPVFARPIEKGHFHDVFTSDVYDCDGTPAQDLGTSQGTSWATSAAHHRSRTSAKACTAPS